NDKKGVELAFWEDEIWAQNDSSTGGLFTHGEGAAFDTTASLTDYQVMIVGDTYTVTAGTNVILTGAVRDYTDFAGTIDPYETPNFLFFGDDTTSAQARIHLSYVSVTPVFSDFIYLPVVIAENAGAGQVENSGNRR
ncbi:MAG TPA: hypothetical protein VI451_18355, partial [Anaerolineales bacterium]|nr:hypothetical protein [Anaerolineales bacterium]